MKKLTLLLLTLLSLSGFKAWAQGLGGVSAGMPHSAPAERSTMSQPQGGRGGGTSTQTTHAPVMINLSNASSGGHNRNFPSQQPSNSQFGRTQPSYGQIHWNNQDNGQRNYQNNNQRNNRTTTQNRNQEGFISQTYQRPSIQNYSQPGVRAAVAVHHHPYTQGYVRKKLQKLGVSAEPSLITDRAEMIHTDRLHSTITFPRNGPDHTAIIGTMVSPRHYNDGIVRDHMNTVDSVEWRARLNQFSSSETRAGHYYWHNDDGVNYCHYIDNSGYHWYGWYLGDQYFWTRNFNGRWWWYDSDYDRWCFWNNGFWWWQDPYHVSDLYCYNNDNYIPCNSAEDQVVVTASNNANMQSNVSPDGTRIVKVDADTQDAFLYDTANPPTFDPVYLASGVQSVQFSDTSNGRPLEIILKLNDGSFDLFDGQGNPYGPGTFDADQAAQANGNNPPPVPQDNSGMSN